MKTVYFIKPIGIDGPVKIGCSGCPADRRRSLEEWCPFPLEVVATIPGSFAIERRFHALFADSHYHGEWFNWSAELGHVIDAVKAGTFDIASLPEGKVLRRPRGPWSEAERESHERGKALRRAAAFAPAHISTPSGRKAA